MRADESRVVAWIAGAVSFGVVGVIVAAFMVARPSAPAPLTLNVHAPQAAQLVERVEVARAPRSEPAPLAGTPVERPGHLTVTSLANVEVAQTGLRHLFARCFNQTSGAAVYIVRSTDTDVATNGVGPFCDTCALGASLPPLGKAYLRAAAATATIACGFVEDWPSAMAMSSGGGGMGTGLADTRYIKLDGSNDGSVTADIDLPQGLSADGTTFCVDKADNQVGVGTCTPGDTLTVEKSVNTPSEMRSKNTNAGASALAGVIAQAEAATMVLIAHSNAYAGSYGTTGLARADSVAIGGNNEVTRTALGGFGAQPVHILSDFTNAAKIGVTVEADNDVIVGGTSGTSTNDALHVVGGASLTGDIAVSGGDVTSSAATFNITGATDVTITATGDDLTLAAGGDVIIDPTGNMLATPTGAMVLFPGSGSICADPLCNVGGGIIASRDDDDQNTYVHAADTSAPALACDAGDEVGRLTFDANTDTFCACDGTSGWKCETMTTSSVVGHDILDEIAAAIEQRATRALERASSWLTSQVDAVRAWVTP